MPWTIVRATQFHNLVLGLIQSFGADTLPLVPVPGAMRFQSIDVGEVADQLVALVEVSPAGHAPDMGGPQILTIEEMTGIYLRARGREASVQSEALSSGLFDTFRSGINLVPNHTMGVITWEDFLRHTYSQDEKQHV